MKKNNLKSIIVVLFSIPLFFSCKDDIEDINLSDVEYNLPLAEDMKEVFGITEEVKPSFYIDLTHEGFQTTYDRSGVVRFEAGNLYLPFN